MKRNECRDWVEIPVLWSDMDGLRHVNNARYFIYLEIARIHLFEQTVVAASWHEAEQGPILASVTCNFRLPVSYPARIEVGSAVTKISRRSFRVDHAIFLEGADTLMADGHSVVVWVDRVAGQSVELSDALVHALERFAPLTTDHA
jgi:acyl-CoA thioester hydrolase